MPKVKLLVYPAENVVVPFVWFFLKRKRDKAERWRKGVGGGAILTWPVVYSRKTVTSSPLFRKWKNLLRYSYRTVA